MASLKFIFKIKDIWIHNPINIEKYKLSKQK